MVNPWHRTGTKCSCRKRRVSSVLCVRFRDQKICPLKAVVGRAAPPSYGALSDGLVPSTRAVCVKLTSERCREDDSEAVHSKTSFF